MISYTGDVRKFSKGAPYRAASAIPYIFNAGSNKAIQHGIAFRDAMLDFTSFKFSKENQMLIKNAVPVVYPEQKTEPIQIPKQKDVPTRTEYEMRFGLKLLKHLYAWGFTGEIHVGVLFCDGESVRYPDLYIPKLGLIIEVDGSSHDRKSSVLKTDSSRDDFYALFGLHVLRVPNYWVGNEYKINSRINELLRFVFTPGQWPFSKAEASKSAVRIARGRAAGGHLNLVGAKFLKASLSEGSDAMTGTKSKRYFGGLRFKISTTRKVKLTS